MDYQEVLEKAVDYINSQLLASFASMVNAPRSSIESAFDGSLLRITLTVEDELFKADFGWREPILTLRSEPKDSRDSFMSAAACGYVTQAIGEVMGSGPGLPQNLENPAIRSVVFSFERSTVSFSLDLSIALKSLEAVAS